MVLTMSMDSQWIFSPLQFLEFFQSKKVICGGYVFRKILTVDVRVKQKQPSLSPRKIENADTMTANIEITITLYIYESNGYRKIEVSFSAEILLLTKI